MPTSRKAHWPGVKARATLAVVVCIGLAGPAGALAQPAGQSDDRAGAPPTPVKSSGPRPMKLGGTRSKAPGKMKLGGVKVPFAKFRLGLGGSRSNAPGRPSALSGQVVDSPRRDAPGVPGAVAPNGAERAGSASPTIEQVVAARIVERVSMGAGPVGPQRAFAESLRRHGVSDVDVAPRIRVNRGGGTSPEDQERASRLRALGDRFAANPALAEAVRERIAAGAAPAADLDTARRELAEQGYVEVELGPGDYGFVRPRDPAALERIASQRDCIRSVADTIERTGAGVTIGRNPVVDADRRRGLPGGCDDDELLDHRREVGAQPGMPPDPFLSVGGAASGGGPDESILETAAAAWAGGEFGAAASSFRAYLKSAPEDTEVRRLLGLSLLLAGDTAEGVEALGVAYETDPNLAARPMAARSFAGHAGELRRAVAGAVALGHRTRGHRAWLAASVLMHAEGRTALAERMLARAAECGLPDDVEAEMRLALGS